MGSSWPDEADVLTSVAFFFIIDVCDRMGHTTSYWVTQGQQGLRLPPCTESGQPTVHVDLRALFKQL